MRRHVFGALLVPARAQNGAIRRERLHVVGIHFKKALALALRPLLVAEHQGAHGGEPRRRGIIRALFAHFGELLARLLQFARTQQIEPLRHDFGLRVVLRGHEAQAGRRRAAEQGADLRDALGRELPVLRKGAVVVERRLQLVAHVHEGDGKPLVPLAEVGFVAGIEEAEPRVRRHLPELQPLVDVGGERLGVRARRVHLISLVQHFESAEIIPVLQAVFHALQQKFVAQIERPYMIGHTLSPKSLRKSASSNV